jgi:hypothetical protein
MHKYTLLNGAFIPIGFDQLEVIVLPALNASYVDSLSLHRGYLFSVPTLYHLTVWCVNLGAWDSGAGARFRGSFGQQISLK